MMTIKVELAYGELLDKITILQIKSERIADENKLSNVNKELSLLNDLWALDKKSSVDISEEFSALKVINEKIWDIEDGIRDKERVKEFDQEFVELARSVYFSNDKRAEIKRTINLKLGSDLIEEKSYADYE
ncbi:MAG: DUF6165 family protein [Gammaproteobacteria bacterium]|nr:DUF6165 family protein [Gammaproteobacteria bacterium]MCW9030350.1 DUF6165 family protein [Gammaproteobacteria bacterium]